MFLSATGRTLLARRVTVRALAWNIDLSLAELLESDENGPSSHDTPPGVTSFSDTLKPFLEGPVCVRYVCVCTRCMCVCVYHSFLLTP
jgi:hypothetical protein